jgi:hypothetical protein
MPLSLDHLIITVADLDTAMKDYTARGYTVRFGGVHADGATHNALIVFADGSYIELLAKTSPDAKTGYQYYFAHGDGITGYALLASSLEEQVARLTQQGVTMNPVVSGGRKRSDGIELKWQVVSEQNKPVPFYMQDLTERGLRVDASATTHANAATGIHQLHFVSSDFEATRQRLSVLLDAAPSHASNTRASWQVGATSFNLSEVTEQDDPSYAHATSRPDVPYAME